MSIIFQTPLTPEQIKKLETVSDEQLRKAQDALFLNLLARVAELEAKTSDNSSGDKMKIYNSTK